jgi:hypothetical protein
VTDFTDAMGYCEFKIPFLIEGVKVKTEQMVTGSEHHDELERIEREIVIPVPLTKENLENKKIDLSFMREDVNTVFTHEFDLPSGPSRVTLFGRADKVYRENEVLIISDDKHTANPGRHDSLKSPYNDQLLLPHDNAFDKKSMSYAEVLELAVVLKSADEIFKNLEQIAIMKKELDGPNYKS